MGPNMQGRLFQLKMDLAASNEVPNNNGLNEIEVSLCTSGLSIHGSHGGAMGIMLLLYSVRSQLKTSILKVTS